MKRALVVLITLALLAVSATVFAETTIKGDFMWFGNYDFDTSPATVNAGDVKGRVKLDTMVDKFNEIYVELRAEGLFVAANDFYLKNFKLVSDLTGALGLQLPFTAKLTLGYWDTYFTGWWYADSTGWDFYYGGPNPSLGGLVISGANWSNGLIWSAETKPGAMQFDIGVGPVTLHYYNDLAFTTILAGADATIGPLGVWLSYGAFQQAGKKSPFDFNELSLELKYAFPEMSGFKLALYPFFRYYLNTPVPPAGDNFSTPFTWGLSAAGDYTMFHLGLGVQGDAQAIIDHFFGELSVAPVAGAKIGVNGYFDTHLTKSILTGIDIYGSYKFGAANLIVGYLIGGTDKLVVPLYNDNPAYKNGLYFGADCSF